MSQNQKTVAIYARVSTDKQKVDMQIRELRDFVNRSGYSTKKRTGKSAMHLRFAKK